MRVFTRQGARAPATRRNSERRARQRCRVPAAQRDDRKVPIAAKVRCLLKATQILTGVISATDIPFSSYVAHPRTPLHRVDARIKQAWLLGLVFVIPRAPWQLKLGLVVATAALAVTCLPRRLSAAQLSRLLPLAALICVMASLTADQTVPSVVSSMPPPELQDLPSLERLSDGYQYTFFSFAFLSVSRFSLGLGASAGAVTFALLQLTATFLVTTPPEQMALSFRWFLSPLRLVGVPVERATFRLLLALRFVSLVFDEVRNLALGLAARGVPWRSMARSSSIAVGIMITKKLFSNLFARSRFIAESLVARGVGVPGSRRPYHLNVPILLPSNIVANAIALATLVACVALSWRRRTGL